MIKKVLIIFFPFLLLASFAYADITVKAELEEPEISIDENATITVSVTGKLNSSDPVAPKVQGLDIVNTGRTSDIEIINGSMTIKAEFIYNVVADQEGHYEIPPFTLFAGGVEYKSNSLSLTVSKQSYSTQPQVLGGPQTTPTQPPPQQGGSAPQFWIESSVNKKDPYYSEQILYKLKLYTLAHITSGKPFYPKFTDFIAENVAKDVYGKEIINGRQYATWEVVFALIPLKEGPLTIDKSELDISYEVYDQSPKTRNRWDPFFNNSFFDNPFKRVLNKTLSSHEIQLNVKPLPQPYPKNYTGLVGEFGVQSHISSTNVKEGESLTLEVNLSGSGNIKEAVLPKLSFDGFKAYFDKPSVDVYQSAQGISGKKTFKIALVPTESGELKIPDFTLSYFDPKEEKYIDLPVTGAIVQVAPSEDEQTKVVMAPTNGTTNGQKVSYQEIAPIQTESKLVLKSKPLAVPRALFHLVILGLPFGFVSLLITKKIKSSFNFTNKKTERKTALKLLLKHLSQSEKNSTQIIDSIRQYVTLAFGVEGKALTSAEIKQTCLAHKISESLAERLKKAIEELEAAQYGFDKRAALGKISNEMKDIINQIEKLL